MTCPLFVFAFIFTLVFLRADEGKDKERGMLDAVNKAEQTTNGIWPVSCSL